MFAAPWLSALTVAALPKHETTKTSLVQIERIEKTEQQDLESLAVSLDQEHQSCSIKSVRRSETANVQNKRMLEAVVSLGRD